MPRLYVSLGILVFCASMMAMLYVQFLGWKGYGYNKNSVNKDVLYSQLQMLQGAQNTLMKINQGLQEKKPELVEQSINIASICSAYIQPVLQQFGSLASSVSTEKLITGCVNNFLQAVKDGTASSSSTPGAANYSQLLELFSTPDTLIFTQADKNFTFTLPRKDDNSGGVLRFEPVESGWRLYSISL
jgi:hypothetical protein